IYADEPLEETFHRLARFGYQGVELKGEPEQYDAGRVRSLAEQYELEITSVLGWALASIPGRDLASPNAASREQAVEYASRCVDLAAAVGAPIVVVIPAAAGRTAPAGGPHDPRSWREGYSSEWGHAVDSVKQAAAYAREYDITLALEPINRYETFLVKNVEEGLRFIEEVGAGNLKLHLDTFHMNLEEPNPARAVRKAGDSLVNMHLSDSNRQAPGKGHFDFESLFAALQAIEYRGALALEPVPPGSDPILATQMPEHEPLRDQYAAEGIRYLKALEAA
ncbi:MAG: sugar phosphate isomerase/epimerase family protein, partial [Anaerolineales bacterium]|nr:sugar phosphate isomerase/epimerase family protein [Anaerolineales bacterium]